MKNKFGEGWKNFKDSLSLMFKKPVFLVPLLFSWIVVASVVLYNRYYFPEISSIGGIILYVYLMVVIISFSIIMANVMMLEFVQHLETGNRVSFWRSFIDTFGKNFLKLIPIIFIWSFFWFIILILKALASKSRKKRNAEPSARDAAMTLSGANTPFSFARLGLDMLEKGIRMTIFMTLPAVAWENKGPFSSFKKSFSIIKKHPLQFLTSYSLTLIASIIMALPLIPIYFLDEIGIVLPSIVWIGVILYIGIIWTIELYLEQMSVGLLYLWHLKWVDNGSKGELSSIKKPDLLDDVHELNMLNI